MTWILQALILSCAVLTPGMSLIIYKARENDNITIRWDSSVRSDLTNSSVYCVFLSKSIKVLYQRLNGIQSSEFLQFAERVQCDGDALREGRVVLHLSKVTAEDAGTYRCDLHTNYNHIRRRWETHMYENFLLNVTTDSGEDNHQVLSSGPASGAGAEDPPARRKPTQVNDPTGAGTPLAVVALVVLIVYAVYRTVKPWL